MGKTNKLLFLAITLIIAPVITARAQTPSATHPLFSELLTKGQDGRKFIELFNPGDQPIELDGWKIQRGLSCGGAASSTTVVALKGQLQPRGYFLVAKAGVSQQPDIEHALSNLCAEYGHLRLLAADGTEQDAFGWGAGALAADSSPFIKTDSTGATTAFDEGESFKRRVDEDGRLIDSGDSQADWFASATPSPASSQPPQLVPGGFEPSTGNLGGLGSSGGQPAADGSDKISAKLELSELFIDPDKPLTDADDEFVEIYNPTKESVDLEDYVIRTGATFSYSFTLPAMAIASGQYLALFSIDTGLTLSNSGGAARLIGPDGQLIYEVPPYDKAKVNTAWALIGGQWQWTAKPTPNAANLPGSAGEDAGRLSSGGQVLAASTGADGRTVYQEPPASAEEQVNSAVVAGVGGMALLYAGYEYRYDLGNAVHKFKRYLKSRRPPGPPA